MAGLVVEYLEVNSVAATLEMLHDVFVLRDAVSVVPELKGFYHNGIGVDVVLQNIVVVANVGADE